MPFKDFCVVWDVYGLVHLFFTLPMWKRIHAFVSKVQGKRSQAKRDGGGDANDAPFSVTSTDQNRKQATQEMGGARHFKTS